MTNIDELKRLKVAKVKTLKSLSFFTRYHFKHNTGQKFIFGKPHQQIAEALERVLKGECTRLIINICPRLGKTELAVKYFIAHGLALNPASKYIHLSYSDSLALDNSEKIKEIVQSESFQQLYPEVQIKKDSKAKEKWYTVQGGGVLARSSGSAVTGFGAGTVDLTDEEVEFLSDIDQKTGFGGAIVVDDPLKADDADSDVIRSRINERFDATVRTRVNSKKTPIIVIMQRLHPMDLSGYLMENEPDEWEVISLPVIDENGESIFPEKFPLDYLEKLEKANPYVFQTQYMQNPRPKDGIVFPEDELKRFRKSDIDLTQRQACIGFIDVADQGADYHSMPIGKLIGDKVYIDEVVFTKEPTEQNAPMCLNAINRNVPEFVQIESNFGGSLYIQLLRINPEIKINGVTALISMNASTSKHTRILTVSGFIKEHFVFLDKSQYAKGSDYDLFMQNLCNYSKKKGASKHDDAPDSLAGLARMAIMYYPHLFDAVYIAQVNEPNQT